jgi:CheY-like chemotaxis protein
MIAITDTGTGIPAAIREKIFDPFFTTKGPGKGTGLGLSTSLAIVKSHGGFINVYSEPGRGTAFKVYLPASPGASPAQTRPPEAEVPRGHGELILVVDDEESVRSLARQALLMFGYKVIPAGDGAEALELYKRHAAEVALVFTDMMMPVMDGPATIEALRQINPGLKVIAASGLNADARLANSRPESVTAFLSKPYTSEMLLKTVHETLHG